MAVKRRPTSGEYPTKYVQKPSAYWQQRGLVLSFLGNKLIYSRGTPVIPTLTATGTPKLQSGPHSDAIGFGATYGTGTSDMLTGGVLPVTTTGERSVFSSLYRNGTGGAAVGRVFQNTTGTGGNAGESFYFNGTTQIIYLNYIVAGGSAATWAFNITPPVGRWASVCIAIPDMTGFAATSSCYIDGVLAGTVANAGVSGGLGSNVATNLTWGNRTTTVDRNFDGMLGITHIFDTELSAEDAEKLNANPNCVWAAENVRRSATTGATGTVATTNANDTASASGTTTVVGTLAKSNANDSSTASGTTTVVGSLAYSNANDTSVASGAVGSSISGTVAATNANDTSSAAGTTTVVGTVAKSNANDTAAASGTSTVIGTVAYSNAADTSSASGIAGAITGTVNVSNENDTCYAIGTAGNVSVNQPSGGWTGPQQRRRTKKELYAERVRLGILPPAVVAAAKKVVEVIEEAPVYEADQRHMETLFMEELKVTKWLPDYSRAIQIQLEIKKQEQDEDDELMLMM